MKWTLTLPLPPSACSKSQRTDGRHWGGKSAVVSEYRELCRMLFCEAFWDCPLPLPLKRISISYRVLCGPDKAFRFRDGRYRAKDVDNAIFSLSPAQDSLVDAGIVADDTAEYVRLGGVEVRRGKGEECGVEVTISEWAEEAED